MVIRSQVWIPLSTTMWIAENDENNFTTIQITGWQANTDDIEASQFFLLFFKGFALSELKFSVSSRILMIEGRQEETVGGSSSWKTFTKSVSIKGVDIEHGPPNKCICIEIPITNVVTEYYVFWYNFIFICR